MEQNKHAACLQQREHWAPGNPQGELGADMLRYMNDEHDAVTNWALDLLDWEGIRHVLDIGCGGGATLARILRRVETTTQVTGVDYSEVAVEQSRLFNAEAVAAGRVQVVNGSVERLPFGDNTFDRIVTVESFYFWPQPQDNLREVLRVLKPGGKFALVADIYEHPGLSERARTNIAMFRMFNPTLEEFRTLLEQAGFRQVVINTKEGTDWVCALGAKAEC